MKTVSDFFSTNFYEDTKYIKDLITSIIAVDQAYCKWDYNKTIQKTERVFAYELYHQFKLLVKREDNILRYEDLRFDGEIGKKYFPDIPNLETRFNVEQKDFSPDLVLHKGQLDSNQLNQKLIVEIKTKANGSEEVVKDIIKLNYSIIKLNFQFGVFISVNTLKSTLIQNLKSEIKLLNEYENNFRRIIIIHYDGQNLRIENLYNILKN